MRGNFLLVDCVTEWTVARQSDMADLIVPDAGLGTSPEVARSLVAVADQFDAVRRMAVRLAVDEDTAALILDLPFGSR